MIGIALPITNRFVDRDFFLSFAAMQKPQSYKLLAPSHEIYSHPKDIADARNGLVRQALESECEYLIMMDTDQIYPADTITKIMSGLECYHAFGGVIHRRYPPFNPLVLRGELGRYERVSDDETYSGDWISVDATGCGCIGYRMDVFKTLKYPWFELEPGPSGKPVGEDIRLCSKIRGSRMIIGVDTSLQIDHLTTFRVDRGTHQLFERFEKWHLTNQEKTAR